jgi:hypothetical protein
MSRSQTASPASRCQGIAKDSTRCAFNGKHVHDDKYFCTTHYKQTIRPSPPPPTICNGQTKDSGRCSYVGKYIHEDKHYCATHYKQTTQPTPPPSPICDGQTKGGGRCVYVGRYTHEGKHYCATHYKKSAPADQRHAAPLPARPTPTSKPKPSADISPTDSLLEIVHSFLKLRIGDLPKADRKKRGREILLKIHPDKCRIPNIDAHGLTQKVLAHMQQ